MRPRTPIFAALLLAFAGAGAFAAPLDKESAEFIQNAAKGNHEEVLIGRMVTQRATDAQVKQFAESMVADHGKSNDELRAMATKWNVDFPATMDEKHMHFSDQLAKMSGADFDKSYMEHMVKDHDADLAMFQKYARDGQHEELKAWAQKNVATIEDHLKRAREIHKRLGGTAALEPRDAAIETSFDRRQMKNIKTESSEIQADTHGEDVDYDTCTFDFTPEK